MARSTERRGKGLASVPQSSTNMAVTPGWGPLDRVLRKAGVIAVEDVVGEYGVVTGVSEHDRAQRTVRRTNAEDRHVMIDRTRQSAAHDLASAVDGETAQRAGPLLCGLGAILGLHGMTALAPRWHASTSWRASRVSRHTN